MRYILFLLFLTTACNCANKTSRNDIALLLKSYAKEYSMPVKNFTHLKDFIKKNKLNIILLDYIKNDEYEIISWSSKGKHYQAYFNSTVYLNYSKKRIELNKLLKHGKMRVSELKELSWFKPETLELGLYPMKLAGMLAPIRLFDKDRQKVFHIKTDDIKVNLVIHVSRAAFGKTEMKAIGRFIKGGKIQDDFWIVEIRD